MADKESDGFKIMFDDESPETHLSDDFGDKRIKSINRKVTLLSIVVPCIMIAIILVVYLDIRKRFIIYDSTGEQKVQNVSKDLESRFSSLSIKTAAMEEAFNKEAAALKKTTVTLRANWKDNKTAISQIRTRIKKDKTEVTGAIAKVEGSLKPVHDKLKTLSTDVTTLDKKIREEMSLYNQTLKKAKNDIIKLQADLTAVSSDKIDQKELDQSLKKQQQEYLSSLDRSVKDLEKKITAAQQKLEQQIARVEKLASQKRAAARAPAAAPKPKAVSSPTPKPKAAPAPKSKTASPDAIVEEDLQ